MTMEQSRGNKRQEQEFEDSYFELEREAFYSRSLPPVTHILWQDNIS